MAEDSKWPLDSRCRGHDPRYRVVMPPAVFDGIRRLCPDYPLAGCVPAETPPFGQEC
jgi:hypothetical protein